MASTTAMANKLNKAVLDIQPSPLESVSGQPYTLSVLIPIIWSLRFCLAPGRGLLPVQCSGPGFPAGCNPWKASTAATTSFFAIV